MLKGDILYSPWFKSFNLNSNMNQATLNYGIREWDYKLLMWKSNLKIIMYITESWFLQYSSPDTTFINSIPNPTLYHWHTIFMIFVSIVNHINIRSYQWNYFCLHKYVGYYCIYFSLTYLKSWDLAYHPRNHRHQNIPISSNSYSHHFFIQVWEQTPFFEHRSSQPLVFTCTPVRDQLTDFVSLNSLTKSKKCYGFITHLVCFLFLNNVTIFVC